MNTRHAHRQSFTYLIPSGLDVRIGDAVLVPFGRQIVQGIVVDQSAKSTIDDIRPIQDVVRTDEGSESLSSPLLTPIQIHLATWISQVYLAPIFTAVSLFLPPGFSRRPKRLLKTKPFHKASTLEALNSVSRAVLDIVANHKVIEFEALRREKNSHGLQAAVRNLIQQGLVEERYELSRPSVKTKYESWLTLDIPVKDAIVKIAEWPHSRKSRPADLLERLLDGPIALGEADRIAPNRKSIQSFLDLSSYEDFHTNQVRLARDMTSDVARTTIDSFRRTGAERRKVATLQSLLNAPRKEAVLRRELNITRVDIDELIQSGLVVRDLRQIERDPMAMRKPLYEDLPTILTDDQMRAFRAVADALDQQSKNKTSRSDMREMFLLRGVTGSGKTEVYVKAVEHARLQGGRSIVLVPEIALTAQLVERFLSRYPGRVALLHSALSARQAFDQWNRIRHGHVDVVIGPRSALFAPLPGLALIIVDEEHEWTYKQTDPAPRYHTREVVEHYARLSGAVVVFASATPDLVSNFRAKSGVYQLLNLPNRVSREGTEGSASLVRRVPLPQVEIVDMRSELRIGNKSIFSNALKDHIDKALTLNEQVILFLNRRGVSSYVCRACGDAIECRRCSVPFTYHKLGSALDYDSNPVQGVLRCHECGAESHLFDSCPTCKDVRVRPMGLGTQRLEQEVALKFPLARPLRWDRDTVTAPADHERLLEKFKRGEANVLVGTQMVAKGLDIPSVTVVGVINADLSLRLPDFSGPERTFQLISQVAGRAGRGKRDGNVIVQTYSPDHYAIRAAAAHDYEAFCAEELPRRAQINYPPYGRLARIVYADKSLDRAQEIALEMAVTLVSDRDRRGFSGPEILGPTPSYVARRRGLYRQQITLRGSDPLPLLQNINFATGWSVDIDPVSLL